MIFLKGMFFEDVDHRAYSSLCHLDITRSGALKLRFSVLWNWALEDENYVPSLAALDKYIPEEVSPVRFLDYFRSG